MEHLLLKAATTATDRGTFTAVISTATVDRDKDIIEPAGMVASLSKWAGIGKMVPLAWAHTDEVVGHIDPATARAVKGEVIAEGWVDQSTERGQETWRLVKSGTLSFSFGFLFEPERAEKLEGGGHRIKELDVFEISVVPVGPANNDTRVLEWKSLTEDAVTKELQDVKARLDKLEKALTEKNAEPARRAADPLEQKARAAVMGVFADGSKPPERVTTEEQPPGPDMEPDELKRRSRDLIVSLLNE